MGTPVGVAMSQQDERTGRRWGVYREYKGPFEPEEDGRFRVPPKDREPDSYIVRDQFEGGGKTYRFKSAEAAERRAAELNRCDVQGPLDPAFKTRRNRLKRLEPHYRGWMYEGPPEARWPVRPARYLIQGHDDGWHGEARAELVETLEAVREHLEGDTGHEVYRVIDLDTGKGSAIRAQRVRGGRNLKPLSRRSTKGDRVNDLLRRIANVLTEMRCLAEGSAQRIDSEPVTTGKSGWVEPRAPTSTHDHHLRGLFHWLEQAEKAVEREKRREPTEDKPGALEWRILNEHIGRRLERVAEHEGVTVETVIKIRKLAKVRQRDGLPLKREPVDS